VNVSGSISGVSCLLRRETSFEAAHTDVAVLVATRSSY
jgi:hypothetical protein